MSRKPPDDAPTIDDVMEFYDNRCIRCKTMRGISVHEIYPKSSGGTWWKIENRVPLCWKCHNWAHSRGTRYSREELLQLVKEYHHAPIN